MRLNSDSRPVPSDVTLLACQKCLKSAQASIKANSDVYLGFTAWSAGAFDQNYELSLTPNGNIDTVNVHPNLQQLIDLTRFCRLSGPAPSSQTSQAQAAAQRDTRSHAWSTNRKPTDWATYYSQVLPFRYPFLVEGKKSGTTGSILFDERSSRSSLTSTRHITFCPCAIAAATSVLLLFCALFHVKPRLPACYCS